VEKVKSEGKRQIQHPGEEVGPAEPRELKRQKKFLGKRVEGGNGGAAPSTLGTWVWGVGIEETHKKKRKVALGIIGGKKRRGEKKKKLSQEGSKRKRKSIDVLEKWGCAGGKCLKEGKRRETQPGC